MFSYDPDAMTVEKTLLSLAPHSVLVSYGIFCRHASTSASEVKTKYEFVYLRVGRIKYAIIFNLHCTMVPLWSV